MNSKPIANGILRAVFILTTIVLSFYFLFKIQSVLAYLAIAAVIALLGRPIVLFLRRKLKMPNLLAVILTMVFMLGVFIGILALFIPLITEQSKNLSLLDINALRGDLNTLYLQIVDYFGISTSNVNDIIEDADIEKNVLEGLNLNFIPNFLNSFLNVLSNFSIGLFSVLFISFFFLKDSKLFQNGILTWYFAGILLQLFILFVIYTITLFIVGVENAIVIAFLCALFNIIPYVGPMIGGAIMITLTMTSNLGMDFSSVILPKAGYVLIFSNSVKSHPLEIFLIIIIAGLLFGVVGMVIAVPGYTAIKVILKEFLSDNSFVKKLTKDL